jgi:hypothetical protein
MHSLLPALLTHHRYDIKIPVFYTVFQAMQRGRGTDNLPSHLTVSKRQGSVICYLTITLPFRVSLRLLLKGSPGPSQQNHILLLCQSHSSLIRN